MILPEGVIREAVPEALVRYAFQTIQVEAGTSLKIETSPGGEEVLDVTVPAGKKWTVGLAVGVVETDA